MTKFKIGDRVPVDEARALRAENLRLHSVIDGLVARVDALEQAIGDPQELWDISLMLPEGSAEMRHVKRIALTVAEPFSEPEPTPRKAS